jgi:hypothetical protein
MIFIRELRLDIKTLIAADNAMIWQKNEKETEEKLDIDSNIRMKADDTTAK